MIVTMNLRLYFLVLLLVVPLCSPLSAQEIDEDGQCYLGFAGSAVFPYEPESAIADTLRGGTNNFKAGAGFTAAFGYAFKEGFSTEMEWGYQKIRTDNPIENLSRDISLGGFSGFGGLETLSPSITIENKGEIKTQSLMGNVYYRYPEWRVSPYAGFGLGAFFHDGTVTSTVTIENLFSPGGIFPDIPIIGLLPPIDFPTEPLKTTAIYEDSRFAYQIMAGLSAEVFKLVEFRFGYRFRSSRGEPIDADHIEGGIRFRF